MKSKQMEKFISKLDYFSLIKFDELYMQRKYMLIGEFWTIDEVKEQLSYYLDGYMVDYLVTIGQLDYYPDGFEHKFDLEDELFLKFLGVPSVSYLLDGLFEVHANDGRTNIDEVVDFAWDDYCKYYHDVMVRDNKLGVILE
ncbi:hypothetical protein [Mucilaginibacter gotjawali]|uniref:Uncharacterized protein n=1 Tax=Mucilaginibacter gotjawali TaxID=1550579 RepID=A0A839SR98_9SPHI|nr:hypothetical protein [Mucilaginibacter gotjawali]MBB3058989.1 hypothetical protein [Mucilaginibacter gotjawali]